MARPKGAKNKSKATAKNTSQFDPRIEEIYETIIEYDCPKRGKVRQKVLVKRIKPPAEAALYQVGTQDPMQDLKLDDGLTSTYGAEEE